jgi:hypothetical protein
MVIDRQRARACASNAALRLTPLLFCALVAATPASAQPGKPVPALAEDEVKVSTGSWSCGRYVEAVTAPTARHAPAVTTSVHQFALGYVYGVSDAVGKPFPESAANEARILVLLGKACAEDDGRAVRDATLLAGRAMLEDSRTAPDSGAPGATGATGCSVYLDARPASGGFAVHGRHTAIQDWADGYINARFERAGRGLIPTAKNKALMLERFSAACAERPAASVREAARHVVETTLPKK